MSAVDMLDDDTYVGAETSFNIFVCKKNSEAATEDERRRLDVVGAFHVGEFINCFRKGLLFSCLVLSKRGGLCFFFFFFFPDYISLFCFHFYFKSGSLVMQLASDEEQLVSSSTLFATTNGVIGVLGRLTQANFEFLDNVQTKLATIIKGVGGLSHRQ